MSSWLELRKRNREKASKEAIVFEHLFPGCRWRDLPRFRLRSLIMLFGITEFEGIHARFGAATVQNVGFAERVDLPGNPDRFILSPLFYQVTPVSDTSHPYLRDLLKPGERFGGIASRKIQWVSTDPAKNSMAYGLMEHDPPDWMRKTAYGKIIGVLNPNHRPSAYILYREGRRPSTNVVWKRS